MKFIIGLFLMFGFSSAFGVVDSNDIDEPIDYTHCGIRAKTVSEIADKNGKVTHGDDSFVGKLVSKTNGKESYSRTILGTEVITHLQRDPKNPKKILSIIVQQKKSDVIKEDIKLTFTFRKGVCLTKTKSSKKRSLNQNLLEACEDLKKYINGPKFSPQALRENDNKVVQINNETKLLLSLSDFGFNALSSRDSLKSQTARKGKSRIGEKFNNALKNCDLAFSAIEEIEKRERKNKTRKSSGHQNTTGTSQ